MSKRPLYREHKLHLHLAFRLVLCIRFSTDTALTGGNNQNWLIQPTDNGYYKIINVNSGKALEVKLGTNPATPLRNGTAVDQYDYNSGKNQQWRFVIYSRIEVG